MILTSKISKLKKNKYLFLGHLIEYIFTYSWHATFPRKDAKGFMNFFSMSPGEPPLWTWFSDIRLIGMYVVVDSSHMDTDTDTWLKVLTDTDTDTSLLDIHSNCVEPIPIPIQICPWGLIPLRLIYVWRF